MSGKVTTDILELREGSAPSTPAAGKCVVYFKTGDSTIYIKDSAGLETAVLVDTVPAADKELLDNQTSAWAVVEGDNVYLDFKTTNGSEQVIIGPDPGTVAAGAFLAQAGTGGWAATSGAALLLDATTTLELNSSGGKILIGNDAVNQGVDIATAGTRTVTIGSATATVTSTGAAFTWNIKDNVAAPWTVTEGARKYIEIVTTDASEAINFGNVTSNPDYNFLGSGDFTVSGLVILAGGTRLQDSQVLKFGTDGDILYTHATDSVRVTNLGTGTVGYDDDVFNICDPADPTKRMRIDAGSVTAGQTRILTMGDLNINLGDVVGENADVVIPVDLTLRTDVSGTWTFSRVSAALYRLRRTAANAVEVAAFRANTRQRTTSSKGFKPTGVKIQYSVTVAVLDELTVSASFTSMPATGAAVAAATSLGAVTYDGAHDSTGERVAVGEHTLVASFGSAVYLNNESELEILLTVDGSAAGVLDVNKIELVGTECLLDTA